MKRFCSVCGAPENGSLIRFAQWIVPVNRSHRMTRNNMQTVCDSHMKELGYEGDHYRVMSIDKFPDDWQR